MTRSDAIHDDFNRHMRKKNMTERKRRRGYITPTCIDFPFEGDKPVMVQECCPTDPADPDELYALIDTIDDDCVEDMSGDAARLLLWMILGARKPTSEADQ